MTTKIQGNIEFLDIYVGQDVGMTNMIDTSHEKSVSYTKTYYDDVEKDRHKNKPDCHARRIAWDEIKWKCLVIVNNSINSHTLTLKKCISDLNENGRCITVHKVMN